MSSINDFLSLFLFSLLIIGCNTSGSKTNGENPKEKKKLDIFPLKAKPNAMVEYDIDKNGKNDLKAIYDERGHLQKLEIDTNENGKRDRFIFYAFHPQYSESRKVLEQYDDNEDGYPDAEKKFEGNRMIYAWFDTDFNRKPDVWQEVDKYDKITTKIDSDGDGIPDPGGDHIVDANSKMEKKQFNDAYEAYKMALNYNSRSTMSYWGMAMALESMHNYEMAIKHLERYILLKGPNQEQATRKINYLKSKLKENFRNRPVK